MNITCFRQSCAELRTAITDLQADCERNPNPFILPSDIVLGTLWLTEEGPNYVAFDKQGQALGFLAVGWKKEIGDPELLALMEGQTPDLRTLDASIFAKLNPLAIPAESVSRIFAQTYNIFMYVRSDMRSKRVGGRLIKEALSCVEEKRAEGYKIRCSTTFTNAPCLLLFCSGARLLGLNIQCYAHMDVYEENSPMVTVVVG